MIDFYLHSIKGGHLIHQNIHIPEYFRILKNKQHVAVIERVSVEEKDWPFERDFIVLYRSLRTFPMATSS